MKKGRKHLGVRFSQKNERLFRILKFIVTFNIFAAPLYFILLTGWTLAELQILVRDVTAWLLTSLGLNPSVQDLIISIPVKNGEWAAFINWDCTGWKSMLAFFALVMATDHGLRRKALGLLLIPLIFVINIVRIVFMFVYVKTFDLAYYQIVHTLIWSWGLILVILALWFVWMKYPHSPYWKNNI